MTRKGIKREAEDEQEDDPGAVVVSGPSAAARSSGGMSLRPGRRVKVSTFWHYGSLYTERKIEHRGMLWSVLKVPGSNPGQGSTLFYVSSAHHSHSSLEYTFLALLPNFTSKKGGGRHEYLTPAGGLFVTYDSRLQFYEF